MDVVRQSAQAGRVVTWEESARDGARAKTLMTPGFRVRLAPRGAASLHVSSAGRTGRPPAATSAGALAVFPGHHLRRLRARYADAARNTVEFTGSEA